MQGIHEKMIQVWPFLPVNLDANKILVHQGGRLEVFKTLPLHDMAPMAGCIANAHNNRFILYRKRKVFFSADGTNKGLFDAINKHKENEKFIYPSPAKMPLIISFAFVRK